MLRLAILALAFAPGLLLAQNAGKIAGKVTDAVTHQPVEGANVSGTVVSRLVVNSRTGIDGSYALEDLPAGSVRINLNRDGYRMVAVDSPMDPNPGAAFELAPGDAVTRSFEMHPLARMHGKVVDRDTGDPIEGRKVVAQRRSGISFGGGATDRGGEFDIRNIEPGDYAIQIGSDNEAVFTFRAQAAEPDHQPQKGYGQRWYPDVPRLDMATFIHLDEGETRSVGIALESRETHALSGTIEAPPGFDSQPISFLFLPADNGGLQARQRTAALGSFRIDNLAPGPYRLAFAAGKPPGEAFADYRFEITDHDIDHFKAVLAPAAGVRGEVRVAEEDAKLPGNLLVDLAAASGSLLPEAAPVESGRFHRESIPPGEYWPLLIGLPAGYAVTQVLFDGAAARGTMSLTSQGTALTFVVTSHPGAVTGIVRDEDQVPVRGASVALLPDPLPDRIGPDAIRPAESGNDGAFVFRDVAPGNYRAVVLTAADRSHERDAGYLRELTPKADRIEVRAGQSVSVNLKR